MSTYYLSQAPFGRGAETVVDTSVRLCRQVEAADVELGGGFDATVQKQAQKYCTTLGAQKEGEELGWGHPSSLLHLIIVLCLKMSASTEPCRNCILNADSFNLTIQNGLVRIE